MCGLFTSPPNHPFNVAFPAEKRKVLSEGMGVPF